MMALAKLFVLCVLTAAGTCGVGSVGAAVYLYSGGIAAVDVETADVDLFIPVPLRLLDVGMSVADLAIPEFDLQQELDAETLAHLEEMQPMLHELINELGRLPSGELVRVTTGNDLIVVNSVRGHLRVEVLTDDAKVKVSIPQRGARRVSRRALALAGI